MDTIAIANLKGGVGKTATACALGTALARDYRQNVLLVDCDPQASLTQATGVDVADGRSLAAVMGGRRPGKVALVDVFRAPPTRFPSLLMVCPSDIALAETELALATRSGKEKVLKGALATVGQLFDVAILDCPPTLNLLTMNALTAADGFICPTIPQAADQRGLRLFLQAVTGIRERHNPGLVFLGALVTFYDRRLTHHRQTIQAMESAGLRLFRTRIGRTVRIAEAFEGGQSLIDYAPGHQQAIAYREFAGEVAGWLRSRRA